MIYSSVVYEQQFNTIINTDIMSEFYQNEISVLEAVIESNNQLANINEANDVIVHPNVVNGDYEVKDVKDSFVKKMIDKIKELIQKFIDWCKKLTASIKGFLLKDCDALIAEINKDIKNIKEAKTITEVIKSAKRIGRVKKYENDTYNVHRFDGDKFIKKNITTRGNTYRIFLEPDLMNKVFNELEKDKKLSDSTKKKIDDYTTLMKRLDYVTKNTEANPYASFVRFRDNISGLEPFKQVLIACGAEDIKTIKGIDGYTSGVVRQLGNLENNSKDILNDLKRLKHDGISSKDISIASKAVNAVTGAGRALYNSQLKILNRALSVYRLRG